MKAALLLQFYFPYGGLQRDCLAMAAGLFRRGVDVTIITRSWDGDQPEGIEVVILGQRGVSNVARDQNFDDDVAQWLAANMYDVTVSFSRLSTPVDFYYAADPCYRVKIERDRSSIYQISRKFRYYASLESQMFSAESAPQLLLLTAMELADYHRLYGTQAERVTVIPPSIKKRDLDLASKKKQREKVRSHMGWGQKQAIVLFVGSGFATKGLDRAIIASAKCERDLKFCIVGDGKTGKYEQQLKKLSASGRVEFLGARDDAWELMVAADLLIHPARSENTGTVLVEALSAGTGVLTTDRCGFSNHIIASEAGEVLASPFDQDELNRVLEKLLSASWEDRAQVALEYAANEDLYSGMKTAVQCVFNHLVSRHEN